MCITESFGAVHIKRIGRGNGKEEAEWTWQLARVTSRRTDEETKPPRKTHSLSRGNRVAGSLLPRGRPTFQNGVDGPSVERVPQIVDRRHEEDLLRPLRQEKDDQFRVGGYVLHDLEDGFTLHPGPDDVDLLGVSLRSPQEPDPVAVASFGV